MEGHPEKKYPHFFINLSNRDTHSHRKSKIEIRKVDFLITHPLGAQASATQCRSQARINGEGCVMEGHPT